MSSQDSTATGSPLFCADWNPRGPAWTPEQDALLGTMADTAAGARIGRSPTACRLRRLALGIPAGAPRGRPRKPAGPPI
jgi:hypothetical protein